MDHINFDTMIKDGHIGDYILGKGIFTRKTTYPEEDYQCWNALHEYYRGLLTESEQAQYINQEILSLYDITNPSSTQIALTLARMFDIQRIEEYIFDTIDNETFDTFPPDVQISILRTISSMRIEQLAIFLVSTILELNILSEFLLLWNSRPVTMSYVGDDDLWRLSAISLTYDSSPSEIQHKIEESLYKIIGSYSKIGKLFSVFLEDDLQGGEIFSKLLAKILEDNVQANPRST